jgi:nitroimidazol reductase NimA-like FMN-containing flavoprotein (pyridoxamine 5'-phosphate oxidase superfamily)
MAPFATEEQETMADSDETDLLEELTEATCRRHLAASSGNVGRIVLVPDGAIRIFPVNYAMHDGAVVMRTHLGDAPNHLGGTIEALGGSAPVAFEIDELDLHYKTGWYVVVHGTVEHVTDAAEMQLLDTLELTPWTHGDRRDWLRIDPTEIHGRRVRWS